MSIFNRLKDGLSKTKEGIFGKVNRLINARETVDDDFLEELEAIFVSADIGFDTSEKIIEDIKLRVQQDKYTDKQELYNLIKKELQESVTESVSGFNAFDFNLTAKPYVIMIVGVNGVGKTTSIGKLAYNFKNAGKSVLIGSADTFRAAANDQLEVWATRAGVEILTLKESKDPGSVAYETIKKASEKSIDVAIIDTAGRLHNKSHLMEELKKIKRVMQKVIHEAPHETFIVIDATTGQNGLNQAKEFASAMGGLTGIILTKLDGTAKGGIVMKIGKEMNIPVRFIGVGEQIDDLQVFNKETFVEALFDAK